MKYSRTTPALEAGTHSAGLKALPFFCIFCFSLSTQEATLAHDKNPVPKGQGIATSKKRAAAIQRKTRDEMS
ncbi:hypothetical protein [Rhodoferax ferrireducens]|uniref:hypothetical protein n=1 Tax=Rhodoferax ferrireducens TaxID=192843 RepID=UPI00140F598A|nr:hypothetical protein [Rhodoferax ferrireducens]